MGGLTSHLRSAQGRLALALLALAPIVFVFGSTVALPTVAALDTPFLSALRLPWYLVGLVLAGAGGLLLYLQWVTGPLRRMSEASQRFANGDFSTLVEESGPPQARALARSLNQMARALARRYEHVNKTVQHSQEVLLALEELAKEQAAEVAAQNVELKAQAEELRRHREVLATQNQVLQLQNQALERASKHKSEFLANMSHELRTPLNAVIGFSEMLLEDLAGPLSPEQRDFVQDILRSGRHLLAMINDILDLAKIEAGRMEIRRERMDLVQAVHEAEEMARPMAIKKGVALELRAQGEVPCLGDAQRLRQVALNLFSNAVKFTPEGGRITCEVRPGPDGQHAELVVADTGIGIDPANHQLIFEQFRQVDGSTTRQHEGTGLGLALVRQFVEAMGGRVSVESQLGQGATFTVRLPAHALEGPLKVLVGSDSAGPRERLLRLLTEAGHQARGLDASSVVAAFEQERPDVLVLDLATTASGLSLLQRLQSGASPSVLVLVAPEASEEETRRLRELGAEVGSQNAPKAELLGALERMTSKTPPRRAA